MRKFHCVTVSRTTIEGIREGTHRLLLDMVGNDVVLPAAGDVLLVHSSATGERVEGLAFACFEAWMAEGSATSFWVNGQRCQEPDLRRRLPAQRAAEDIHNLIQSWFMCEHAGTRQGATGEIAAIAAIIEREGGIRA